MGQFNSDGSDTYDLVRRSDGLVAETLTIKVGGRVLLRRDDFGIGHKNLQKDERIVSHVTLVEMVREMSAKN
ncbi:hypothetical protein [Serratia liquefaciens]|uniref:hypothetical protein n=1 Tax=Serratia liquefaciens TaxID=614 RepID=UPI003905C61E